MPVTCCGATASPRGWCPCRAWNGSPSRKSLIRRRYSSRRPGQGLRRGGNRTWLARIRGDAGECVSLEHFGASAAYQRLYQEFGITAERVATAARTSLARLSARAGE